MTALDIRVSKIINTIEPEFRIPVITAVAHSDGTVLNFQEELASQVWEFPELPVQEIMDKLLFDMT